MNLRLHWDAEMGWIIDVPFTLTLQAVQRICEYAIPKQQNRMLSLSPGDKKEELRVAIELLKRFHVTQRLIDHDGDGVVVPFASTDRTNNKRYFYG